MTDEQASHIKFEPLSRGETSEAPPNSLPDWDECAMRVANSEFLAKRVAEGGYGPEEDSKLATELHHFIYEYDDADSFRSAWFLHRLELLLNETREAATRPTLQSLGGDADLPTMPDLCYHSEYRRGFAACLSEFQRMRSLTSTEKSDGERQRLIDALESLLWACTELDRKNRIRQFDEFVNNARNAIAMAGRME